MKKFVLGIFLLFGSVFLLFAGDGVKPGVAAGMGAAVPAVKLDTATFATGCFWCTQAQFQQLKGVKKVFAGYSGGHVPYPTYQQVCTGTTGHAESCNIIYDPAQISFDELLEAFFVAHDPTTLNRQGNDVGTQYRSEIFYHGARQKEKALYYIAKLNKEKAYPNPIVTQVEPFAAFYVAENYQQDYYNQHGTQPYCRHVIQPELDKFKKVFANKLKHENNPYYSNTDIKHLDVTNAQWKKILSPALYATAREAATEKAFTGQYWNQNAKGTYYCAVCGNLLFRSDAKFSSTCGWPSFFEPVRKNSVIYRVDNSYGMKRTEVLCARCDSHLGHIFDDGPPPTHKRYCMNSIALDFQPDR